MKCDATTVAAVGVTSGLAGYLATRCLAGQAEAEVEEDVPSLAAMGAAVRTFSHDAVDKVITDLITDPPQIAKPAAVQPQPTPSMPKPPTEDQVKGCVSTSPDGTRRFRREEMGIEFAVGPEWVGTEEVAETQPSGRIWMARFGDPQTMGGIGSRQLCVICEQVPADMTAAHYAEKSRITARETMGPFSQVDFKADEPCSVGVFDRRMVFKQTIPFVPNQGMPGPVDITVINYFCLRGGVAYTVQYMAPSHQYQEKEGGINSLVNSVTLLTVESSRGVLTRENGAVRVEVSTELEYWVSPASMPPPSSFISCLELGGEVVDTYTPNQNGTPMTVLVDSAAEDLRKIVDEGFPKAQIGSLRIEDEAESGCIEYVCMTDADEPLAVIMRQIAGRIRVAAWFTLAKTAFTSVEEFRTKWLAHPDRDNIRSKLAEFCKGVTLGSEGAAPKTTFENKKLGVKMTNLPEGSLKDGFLGDLAVAFQPVGTADCDLQLLYAATTQTLQETVNQFKGELSTVGGVVAEEGSGWLGREQMQQVVARVPGPPQQGTQYPSVVSLFVTMVHMNGITWTLQWRVMGEIDARQRDPMEAFNETIRFSAPE